VAYAKGAAIVPSMQTKQSDGLFSFGTRTLPAMQRPLFDAPVPQTLAALFGHGLVDVEIADSEIVRLSGLSVHRGLARRWKDQWAGLRSP